MLVRAVIKEILTFKLNFKKTTPFIIVLIVQPQRKPQPPLVQGELKRRVRCDAAWRPKKTFSLHRQMELQKAMTVSVSRVHEEKC